MTPSLSRRPWRVPVLVAAALAGVLIVGCSQRSAQDTLNRVVSTRGLTVTRDVPYGPDARQRLDVYAPPGAVRAPVVLFVHGGSWEGGDKEGHAFVGESLARAGLVTAVMSYRLAPQHVYPAYVQDTAQALKVVRDAAASLGGDPDALFVMGHSAGAFNAVEAVDNERWLREAGVPVTAVRGVIGVAGPYAYDFRGQPTARAFPPGASPDDVMPDRHVRPDAPPHLLLVAGDDRTVDPRNGERMRAALERAGVPVTFTVLPGMGHITVAAALARPLVFLGPTRAAVLAFVEAHRPR